MVQWILGYSAPVALGLDGQPFTFSSYTVAGRRQQFNLHLDRLFLAAAVDAVGGVSKPLLMVRSQFAEEHQLVLHRRGEPMNDKELERQFEERVLRRKYLEAVAATCGDDVAHAFLIRAAKERVSAMVNAWRNAPIQGGVADIMLASYADLHQRLALFPTARPVQTVHDSVVVECDRSDAADVMAAVCASLEQASLQFCPDVTPAPEITEEPMQLELGIAQ